MSVVCCVLRCVAVWLSSAGPHLHQRCHVVRIVCLRINIKGYGKVIVCGCFCITYTTPLESPTAYFRATYRFRLLKLRRGVKFRTYYSFIGWTTFLRFGEVSRLWTKFQKQGALHFFLARACEYWNEIRTNAATSRSIKLRPSAHWGSSNAKCS